MKEVVILIFLFGISSYNEAAEAVVAALSSGNGGAVQSESSSGGSGGAAGSASSSGGVFEREYSGSNAKGSYDIKYGREENGDNFYIEAGPDGQFFKKEGNLLKLGKGSHTAIYELIDGKIVLLDRTTAGGSTTAKITSSLGTISSKPITGAGTLKRKSTTSSGGTTETGATSTSETSVSTGTGTTGNADTTPRGGTTGTSTTGSRRTSGSAGTGITDNTGITGTGFTFPSSLTPLIDVLLDLGIYLNFPMSGTDTTDGLPADFMDKSFSQLVEIMRKLEKEGITPSIDIKEKML